MNGFYQFSVNKLKKVENFVLKLFPPSFQWIPE